MPRSRFVLTFNSSILSTDFHSNARLYADASGVNKTGYRSTRSFIRDVNDFVSISNARTFSSRVRSFACQRNPWLSVLQRLRKRDEYRCAHRIKASSIRIPCQACRGKSAALTKANFIREYRIPLQPVTFFFLPRSLESRFPVIT